jgi:hypothetical protein
VISDHNWTQTYQLKELYQNGKTKIFVSKDAMVKLEELKREIYQAKSVAIQAFVRCKLGQWYFRRVSCALRTVQRAVKRWYIRSKHFTATRIQSRYRLWRCEQRYRQMLEGARTIQRFVVQWLDEQRTTAEMEEEKRWQTFDTQLDQLKLFLNEADDMTGGDSGRVTSLAELADSFGAGILSSDNTDVDERVAGGLDGSVMVMPPDSRHHSNVFEVAGGLVDTLKHDNGELRDELQDLRSREMLLKSEFDSFKQIKALEVDQLKATIIQLNKKLAKKDDFKKRILATSEMDHPIDTPVMGLRTVKVAEVDNGLSNEPEELDTTLDTEINVCLDEDGNITIRNTEREKRPQSTIVQRLDSLRPKKAEPEALPDGLQMVLPPSLPLPPAGAIPMQMKSNLKQLRQKNGGRFARRLSRSFKGPSPKKVWKDVVMELRHDVLELFKAKEVGITSHGVIKLSEIKAMHLGEYGVSTYDNSVQVRSYTMMEITFAVGEPVGLVFDFEERRSRWIVINADADVETDQETWAELGDELLAINGESLDLHVDINSVLQVLHYYH